MTNPQNDGAGMPAPTKQCRPLPGSLNYYPDEDDQVVSNIIEAFEIDEDRRAVDAVNDVLRLDFAVGQARARCAHYEALKRELNQRRKASLALVPPTMMPIYQKARKMIRDGGDQ